MHIYFARVSSLSPIEGHITDRANWLEDKIISESYWTTPLVVDNQHGLIMDGHHRFEVSKRLQLRIIPVIICSYLDVEVYSLRPDEIVTIDQIKLNYINKILYPCKTAKHNFSFNISDELEIPIDELK